jgi:hypothetical protein
MTEGVNSPLPSERGPGSRTRGQTPVHTNAVVQGALPRVLGAVLRDGSQPARTGNQGFVLTPDDC